MWLMPASARCTMPCLHSVALQLTITHLSALCTEYFAPQYCCAACIENHSADHCLAVFLMTYAGSTAQPSQEIVSSDAREHALSGSKENDGTTCSHSLPAVHLPEAQAQQAARMSISSPPRATTHVAVQDHDHSKCEKLMQSGHQAGSDSVLSPSQYLVKECR